MPGGLKPVLWLRPGEENAALLAAYPQAPAICVLPPAASAPEFDPRVVLRYGDPPAALRCFLDEHNANQIITMASESPGFAETVRELKHGAMVKVI